MYVIYLANLKYKVFFKHHQLKTTLLLYVNFIYLKIPFINIITINTIHANIANGINPDIIHITNTISIHNPKMNFKIFIPNDKDINPTNIINNNIINSNFFSPLLFSYTLVNTAIFYNFSTVIILKEN